VATFFCEGSDGNTYSRRSTGRRISIPLIIVTDMSDCKICAAQTERAFSKRILEKYVAEYFLCPQCGFLQTSEALWLQEAYGNAITSLDIGLAARNTWLQKEVSRIIDACFPQALTMLDFAGGYGLLVRLMRDEGYNFFRQDDYCENIFARYFDLADSGTTHFDLVTAFEVFEHFNAPKREIRRVLDYGDNLIFSTEIIPDQGLEDWWYLSPETGQHIAFYSLKTLQHIATANKMHFYSNGHNLHLYSKREIDPALAASMLNPRRKSLLERAMNRLFSQPATVTRKRTSLRQSDYKKIQDILSRT
jgi:Methyltransferase domain